MPGFETPEFAARWHAMPLMEQFANIGSEVERALTWTERGNTTLASSALDRSLQLIDLKIADDRRRSPGTLKELTRVREILCDFLLGGNTYRTSPEFLRAYFHAFASTARGKSGS